MSLSIALRQYINTYVMEEISPHLHSSFMKYNPILYFLAATGLDGQGVDDKPTVSSVLGGQSLGRATLANSMGNIEFQFKYQYQTLADGTTVAYRGNTPVASGYATDNTRTAGVRFTQWRYPFKISKHDLMFNRNSRQKIGSILDDSLKMAVEGFLKMFADDLWNGSLDKAGQEETLWLKPLGIKHVLTANNYCYRTDRSVYQVLNPMTIAAGTDLPSTIVDLTIVNKINVGFTGATGTVFTGLAGKSANGKGPRLYITTPDLWQSLRDQADGMTVKVGTDLIPNHPQGGYLYPIIEYNGIYFIADPSVSAGTMIGLNLDGWTWQPHADESFVIPPMSEWGDTEKTTPGAKGDLFDSIKLMGRLWCNRPDLNVYITGLTNP